MPDVFISYNHADKDAARWFAEAFRKEGFDVWWDATIKSGEAYDQVTEDALRSAKAVVVLWSKTSVVSRWVRAEATLADRSQTLVPVMIEPCERPIMFELTLTADLGRWRTGIDPAVWDRFLADVRGHVERAAGPDAAPTAQTAPPHRPPPRGQKGGMPSLAVLPFTNRSGLPEDDVFAFGMVEDIIEAMSRGVEVRVLASSATTRFRDGGIVDLDAMARQLGVRYVLEGNVRRVGDSLRVTTQLIDASSGGIAWTQRFDRPLAQLAALQEELVLEVAANLRTQSHRLEIERALRKVGDLTAWEAVMRSVAALRKMTPASFGAAIEEAKKAVQISPDYGLAVAQLSGTQAILYNQLMPHDPAEANRIRDLAERAIMLDPDNSVVVASAASALSIVEFPEEGLAAGLRAIDLNPDNEFSYRACAMALTLLDRPDEAIAYLDKEEHLAPGHPTIWISHGWRACAHIRADRWDNAAAAYKEALKLTPDNAAPHIGLAVCHRQLGRHPEANACMARGRKLEPDTPLAIWELRYGRAFAGAMVGQVFLDHMRALWAQCETA